MKDAGTKSDKKNLPKKTKRNHNILFQYLIQFVGLAKMLFIFVDFILFHFFQRHFSSSSLHLPTMRCCCFFGCCALAHRVCTVWMAVSLCDITTNEWVFGKRARQNEWAPFFHMRCRSDNTSIYIRFCTIARRADMLQICYSRQPGTTNAKCFAVYIRWMCHSCYTCCKKKCLYIDCCCRGWDAKHVRQLFDTVFLIESAYELHVDCLVVAAAMMRPTVVIIDVCVFLST